LVIKPTPIPDPKEEKSNFISICNRDKFFVESREIEQSLTLEEVSPTAKIFKEMDQSFEEYNGVVHNKLLKNYHI